MREKMKVVPRTVRKPVLSKNGVLREQLQAEMRDLVVQRRQAWAEGNMRDFRKISAKMRALQEKEAKLGSAVIIRT